MKLNSICAVVVKFKMQGGKIVKFARFLVNVIDLVFDVITEVYLKRKH